jgi:hypothetical protein
MNKSKTGMKLVFIVVLLLIILPLAIFALLRCFPPVPGESADPGVSSAEEAEPRRTRTVERRARHENRVVRIETTTDYPFNETLQMRVETAKPVRFPLKLRVPGWCAAPHIAVNGDAAFSRVASETRPKGRIPTSGDGFATIDREWRTGDTIAIRFPMEPRVATMRDFNDGGKPYCSLSLGPLLFARGLAEIDENTPQPGQRIDWRLDSSRVLDGATVERDAMPSFWDWPLASPVRLTIQDADGNPLELIPYGCAKLRVSMFPDNVGMP